MTRFYPVFGESASAIPPQIYNWAQADRGEQAGNIGRQTAWDAQAINNANNYYQFQKSNEAQDYARQQEAEQQAYQRQKYDEAQAQRRNEFAQQVRFSRDELNNNRAIADQNQNTKLLIDNFKVAQQGKEQEAGAVNWLHEGLASGELVQRTPEQLAQMSGLPAAQVAEIMKPYAAAFPDAAIAQLNAQIADIVAKNPPEKVNWEGIRGLKARLPSSVQAVTRWSQVDRKFVRADNQTPDNPLIQMQQRSYSNPGSGPAENYNFGNQFPQPAAPQSPAQPAPTNPVAPQPQLVSPVITAQDVAAAKANLESVRSENPTQNFTQGEDVPISDYFGGAAIREARVSKALDKYKEALDKFIPPLPQRVVGKIYTVNGKRRKWQPNLKWSVETY